MLFIKKKFIQFIYKEKFTDITKLKLEIIISLFLNLGRFQYFAVIVKIMHKKKDLQSTGFKESSNIVA